MTTCPSTQPLASGTSQAISRGSRLPPIPPSRGRNTRTAQKALKPLTPPRVSPPTTQISKVVSANSEEPILAAEQRPSKSPTLPPPFSPFSNPSFQLPSIVELRDFPNLTLPALTSQPSVHVTLPDSAPTSPVFVH